MMAQVSRDSAVQAPGPSRSRTFLNVIDDTGQNLAQWLREVARGKAAAEPSPGAAESRDAILEHLEQRTGRKLRSCDAVDALLKDMAEAETRARRQGMRRGILRGALLLCLLLAAALHYYYWTVSLEIESLPSVAVFGLAQPAPNGQPKPR
jgi:hypothetical protein